MCTCCSLLVGNTTEHNSCWKCWKGWELPSTSRTWVLPCLPPACLQGAATPHISLGTALLTRGQAVWRHILQSSVLQSYLTVPLTVGTVPFWALCGRKECQMVRALQCRDGGLMPRELCYLIPSCKQPSWIKSMITLMVNVCSGTLYLDKVQMIEVIFSVKISGKYTSLIRALSTPYSRKNKVNKLLIWSLVRNVITYILQLLPKWLTWIHTPSWGNLPSLNHLKLEQKKAKYFDVIDLCCARIERIMFLSALNATDWWRALFSSELKTSTVPPEIKVGCEVLKTMSHTQCLHAMFHLPSQDHSIIYSSYISSKKQGEFPAYVFLPCEQLFYITLMFL